MHTIDSVVISHDTARGIDVFDEFLHLIRMARALRVTKTQNAATVWFAIERAVFIGADKQGAIRRGGEVDGIAHHRRMGEDRHVIAFRGLYVLEDFSFLGGVARLEETKRTE